MLYCRLAVQDFSNTLSYRAARKSSVSGKPYCCGNQRSASAHREPDSHGIMTLAQTAFVYNAALHKTGRSVQQYIHIPTCRFYFCGFWLLHSKGFSNGEVRSGLCRGRRRGIMRSKGRT